MELSYKPNKKSKQKEEKQISKLTELKLARSEAWLAIENNIAEGAKLRSIWARIVVLVEREELKG